MRWFAVMVLGFSLFITSIPRYAIHPDPDCCPDEESASQSTQLTAVVKEVNSCTMTSGMYVKKGYKLLIHARATVGGLCRIFAPDQGNCAFCVLVTEDPRLAGNIRVFADINAPPLVGTYTMGYIYPSGGTAIPTIDSTGPGTTGPVQYWAWYAGDHAFQVELTIDMSACTIPPPNVTGATPLTIHVRSALHKGATNGGSLEGGGPLSPDSGTGFVHYLGTDPPNSDTYGGQEAIHQVIKNAGQAWANAQPTAPRMQYGDISKVGGGNWPPHSSHQNGLDVDLRYFRNDGAEDPLNLSVDPQKYSKPLTVELLNLFKDTGLIDLIIVSNLSGITQSDVPGITLSIDSNGQHDNHIHIRITDPDGLDSNNC